MFKITRAKMIRQSNDSKFSGVGLIDTLEIIMNRILSMEKADKTYVMKALNAMIRTTESRRRTEIGCENECMDTQIKRNN